MSKPEVQRSSPGRKRIGLRSLLSIDPAIGEDIIKAVRAGNYVEVAAAYAGVNKATVFSWMKKGARDKRDGVVSEYTTFHDSIKKALAESEVSDVVKIARAAETNWTAAAWRLERKNFKRWGRKDFLAANINLPGRGASDKKIDEETRLFWKEFFGKNLDNESD